MIFARKINKIPAGTDERVIYLSVDAVYAGLCSLMSGTNVELQNEAEDGAFWGCTVGTSLET